MPINRLNSKSVKFSEECKKYDGKNYHIEAYEKFILDILKPRKFKLGISTEQVKKGLKPETYLIPAMTIEESWNYVSDKAKDEVIKLLIDLCKRYENSYTKNIPVILSGSSKTYMLSRKHDIFIRYMKNFLIKKGFVSNGYFFNEFYDRVEPFKLKKNDVDEIVNEMMIFTIEDI